MRLKSFRVQHYKSIDDVTLDIAPDVTVIVGPNGVGKSNFVDAMRFFSMLSAHGVFGVLDVLHQNRGMGAPLPLWLCGSGITYLKATFEKKEEQRLVSVPIQIACNDGLVSFAETSMLLARDYLDNESVPPTETEASQHIQTWQSYTLYPNVLRDANWFRKHSEQHLLGDGKNWVSVLHSMQSTAEGKAALGQVFAALHIVMPGFKTLKITEAANYLIPTFQIDSYNSDLEYGLDPTQLSDGTLRLFGILLAAYQIPRPSLLIIEEPEQTIYPGALSLLADVFKEISSTTQVIITTHSPHLVQQFAPDQIRVATMQDGVTQIRKIHPHQKEAVEEGLLSLEEFMTQGGLQPDDSASASEA